MAQNPAPSPEPAAATSPIAPGTSWFQVLEPSAVLAPNGDRQYGMVGPFADLARASQYSLTRPGSLITVTLVLHQAQAVAVKSMAAPPAG